MKKQRMIQIFLLFVLLILCRDWLFPQIEITNCKNEVVDPGKNKLNDFVVQVVNNLVDESMESAKNCLPESLYKDIKDDLDSRPLNIKLDCTMPPGRCGRTWQLPDGEKQVGKRIDINTDPFRGDLCNCAHGVMLHELLHWGAGLTNSDPDEIKAYSCQLKCYPNCTSIPEKYQGKVKPELCCDKKN